VTAVRKREPSFAREIAAIVKAGLFPHLVRRADGSIELTGLPADKVVSPDYEAEDLSRKMHSAVGRLDGDGV
jgi:hypothetical protein